MLTIDALTSYYGKAKILHGLTFDIARGQVVALLGRNGAGKTTTLKSIMQAVRPATGSVQFDGHALIGKAPFQVAKLGLGYVPEERRIFTDLTILENLEVGRQPARADAPHWSREALFDLFPNLAERRHNLGRELSGGEQQMLSIARTLMGNPSMLLLDEPSEGIAPVIVEHMAETILALKKEGMTVLLSEQNMQFARYVADQALLLESGHLRFHGAFQELMANKALYEAYLAV